MADKEEKNYDIGSLNNSSDNLISSIDEFLPENKSQEQEKKILCEFMEENKK